MKQKVFVIRTPSDIDALNAELQLGWRIVSTVASHVATSTGSMHSHSEIVGPVFFVLEKEAEVNELPNSLI